MLPNGDNPLILIIEVALAAALLIYFYFRRKKGSSAEEQGLQRVEMKLAGTFTPAEVRLQAGRPAQLLIHRYDTTPDHELFEIEELAIYELLPALHTTVLSFHPEKRGRFPMILAGEKQAGIMIVE